MDKFLPCDKCESLDRRKCGCYAERVLDRADKLVGCDHDLGYTFDYDGPSIFSASTKNPTWEFDEGFQEEDDHHGIVYWNFCPKCGQKLTPPYAKVNLENQEKDNG